MPGSARLRDDDRVISLLRAGYAAGKMVCAICAAPIALERAGLLRGRKATSYPGSLAHPEECRYRTDPVVYDERILTSRGVGTAIPFALAMIGQLVSEEKARAVSDAILYTDTNHAG